MARIYAWFVTINLANDRLLGGGFEPWVQPVFDRYGERDFNLENTENPDKVVLAHAAHSIYFSILGEHGWIGLGLFLAVGVMAWRTGSWVLSRTRNVPELAPMRDLVAMLQVSLAAFATGGAFFSLSYWDLGWQLVSMLIICRVIVSLKLAPLAASPAARVLRPVGTQLPAHSSARTVYPPGRSPLSSGS
jgi:probable O-glycosylation ligase (exosortase A-associated)